MATDHKEFLTTGTASRRNTWKLASVMIALSAALVMSADLTAAPAPTGLARVGLGAVNRFSVEIDGVPVAGVQSVEGIESESEIVEFKEGEGCTVRTRPGRTKPAKVTITKDWSNPPEFFIWRQTVIDCKVERKSISVIFFSDNGQASSINFSQCWPVKWTGPTLNATSSTSATEKIEIACETFDLKR